MNRYYCALISNNYQEEIYYFNAKTFKDALDIANQLCKDLTFDKTTYKIKLLEERNENNKR